MPDLSYRSIRISGVPATLDKKSKSVDVIVATERPCEVFDFERYEVVPEILLMSGIEMANSRQVPLLDSHQRFDSASLIGSVRSLVTKDGQLSGTAHFSNAKEAESAWMKVREGHLTDFSVGYKVIEKRVKWFVDEAGNRYGKANADLDMAVDVLLQSENLDRVLLITGDGDFVQVSGFGLEE